MEDVEKAATRKEEPVAAPNDAEQVLGRRPTRARSRTVIRPWANWVSRIESAFLGRNKK